MNRAMRFIIITMTCALLSLGCGGGDDTSNASAGAPDAATGGAGGQAIQWLLPIAERCRSER